MKLVSSLIVVCLSISVYAQIGISGGGSFLKGFSPGKPYGGFHIGLEVPRDDASSFYGRYSYYFPQKYTDSTLVSLEPRDPNTLPPGSPYLLNVNGLPTMNYHLLQFGTRYYLGDGYDFGWAGYGGTDVMIAINQVKMKLAPYDESLYMQTPETTREGSIFSLGFSLNAGVKYSIPPTGTFYLDAGVGYYLLATASTSNTFGNMYNQLQFMFNLGYRKDILW